jgi:hypothetical protein
MNEQTEPVVVISYTHETSELALAQAKAISALGQPCKTCYVISPQEVNNMKAIHDELCKVFTQVKRIPYFMTRKTKNGIQNEMFFLASEFIANEVRAPFIYLDPSCVPLRRGWVDRLDYEFKRSRLLCVGFLIKGGDTDCGIRVRRRITRGAMFSHEIAYAIPTLKFLMRYTAAMEAQGADPLHYEIYCATEIMRNGMATDLVGYYPDAISFREEGGEFRFSSDNEEMEEVQKFIHPRRAVGEQVVLASGCADGSLHNLISKESVLPPEATEKEIRLAKGPPRVKRRGGRPKGSKNKSKAIA